MPLSDECAQSFVLGLATAEEGVEMKSVFGAQKPHHLWTGWWEYNYWCPQLHVPITMHAYNSGCHRGLRQSLPVKFQRLRYHKKWIENLCPSAWGIDEETCCLSRDLSGVQQKKNNLP